MLVEFKSRNLCQWWYFLPWNRWLYQVSYTYLINANAQTICLIPKEIIVVKFDWPYFRWMMVKTNDDKLKNNIWNCNHFEKSLLQYSKLKSVNRATLQESIFAKVAKRICADKLLHVWERPIEFRIQFGGVCTKIPFEYRLCSIPWRQNQSILEKIWVKILGIFKHLLTWSAIGNLIFELFTLSWMAKTQHSQLCQFSLVCPSGLNTAWPSGSSPEGALFCHKSHTYKLKKIIL